MVAAAPIVLVMRFLRTALAGAAFFFALHSTSSAAAPGPLGELQTQLSSLSMHAPGNVGIVIKDLTTGLTSGVNASADMPAASIIKIPVMVEVFRQMSLGTIGLNDTLHLQRGDRDNGWGDLADARTGSGYSVSKLMWLMITESDNTATNMLIRRIGRDHINTTMRKLGLAQTRLGDYIRSDGDIRSLRSSPNDMMKLLEAMAQDRLVDEWSSRAMITILTGQHHNGLLPQPLPRGIQIAHKTGTLHDTLNDVGIVYMNSEPYIIAVMTTHLPSLDSGRRFIRNVSSAAFRQLARFATWRETNEIPTLAKVPVVTSPDASMWQTPTGVLTPVDSSATAASTEQRLPPPAAPAPAEPADPSATPAP